MVITVEVAPLMVHTLRYDNLNESHYYESENLFSETINMGSIIEKCTLPRGFLYNYKAKTIMSFFSSRLTLRKFITKYSKPDDPKKDQKLLFLVIKLLVRHILFNIMRIEIIHYRINIDWKGIAVSQRIMPES